MSQIITMPEESQGKSEPITFGSIISLELSKQNNHFLHSEGFILSRLELKSFVSEESSGFKSDFNYCNFKIVPFSTSSNFKTQISLINKLIKKIHVFHDNGNSLKKLTPIPSSFFSL